MGKLLLLLFVLAVALVAGDEKPLPVVGDGLNAAFWHAQFDFVTARADAVDAQKRLADADVALRAAWEKANKFCAPGEAKFDDKAKALVCVVKPSVETNKESSK